MVAKLFNFIMFDDDLCLFLFVIPVLSRHNSIIFPVGQGLDGHTDLL